MGQFDAVSKLPGEVGAVKLAKLCDVAKSLLQEPPRQFSAQSMADPHLLFTDGAWENQKATAGLLFSELTQVRL